MRAGRGRVSGSDGATGAGDQSDRLFIVDQAGTIRILEMDYGTCLAQPFLDLTAKIVAVNPFFDERGLLGLAFHPKFKTNGRFFVRYSAPRRSAIALASTTAYLMLGRHTKHD